MADPTPTPETTAADHNPAMDKPNPGPSPTSPHPFSNPNPSGPPPPPVLAPPPPAIQPSFRPAGAPVPVPSTFSTQFSPVGYQTPGVPPPGVIPAPGVGSGVGSGPVTSHHPMMAPPYSVAGQPVRYGPPMSNGYPGMAQPLPQGAMPPGVPRYPSPYGLMIRPAFPPRPLVGIMPPLARPPVVGIRGPILPPAVRPLVTPIVVSAEEPQTTVYVGKISSTVENEFMLSLLQVCGPVKNWKRPQDPSGTLKGFGFCEFESAEGVLCAMRLLNKLRVDGQELLLNVNQTTRKYLEHYVEKKIEGLKVKESAAEGSEKDEVRDSSNDTDKAVQSSEEYLKPSSDEQKKDDKDINKENSDAASFGLVIDEDREADHEALEKLTGLIEERLRNRPLPPPPPLTVTDGPGNPHSEQPSGSKDRESAEDVKNYTEEKIEDEKTTESIPPTEPDRDGTGSPDRSRRHDRSRDRDRDLKREKERELERYEREREQERAKREKDREYRSREDERRYKAREKEWDSREREREHWRKREREREKERVQERKWEVSEQEHDGDDGYGKKRKYKISDEERKRRQREKEEDLADRLREEEEIAEAKLRAEEERKKQLEVLETATSPANGHEKAILSNETIVENQGKVVENFELKPSPGTHEGEGILQNGTSDLSNSASDVLQNSGAPTKKLGFGLSGLGKRAAVPSVFNEDEVEDAHKEKKMRPLVPIDYSAEEQQAVQSPGSEPPSANMAAAAEFVKRISTVNPKEEIPDVEREKSRRSHDRSSKRGRDRQEEEKNNFREESRRDQRSSKTATQENQKLLDAKQLIDSIPKTKDELFSYEINWAMYDRNTLHERMRPWVSKKITEFLGEEEATLVDYIVSSTQEHVNAGEMLERLHSILDDEAEMFVLKMWRMLIFEIKRVETGLVPKSKA